VRVLPSPHSRSEKNYSMLSDPYRHYAWMMRKEKKSVQRYNVSFYRSTTMCCITANARCLHCGCSIDHENWEENCLKFVLWKKLNNIKTKWMKIIFENPLTFRIFLYENTRKIYAMLGKLLSVLRFSKIFFQTKVLGHVTWGKLSVKIAKRFSALPRAFSRKIPTTTRVLPFKF